ncbi:MAG: cyanophycin synthetase [Gammaproteobacteria bacterium]|nr:cyanophycin synthetase [Gammaproteobacteria bacterium]
MKILSTTVYQGPNIYALFPVIHQLIDLGELEHWPTARLGDEMVDGLLEALPGLHEHGCSYREPGGFVRRMKEDEGTWLGHVMEHVAIELQNVAGAEVTFGKTRSSGVEGQYDMVFQYEDQHVGQAAGKLAFNLLQHLLPPRLKSDDAPPENFDFAEERDDFIRYAQRRALGPSTASLVRAAEQRDIPWFRLNDYSLIQFGHGRYQKRIQATVTSETRHIAVELASDKEEANRMLGDLGLPVPKQIAVYNQRRAVQAAERIGYPVVIKPLDANHGRGVTTDVNTREQVELAFDKARDHGRTVIVESFIQGLDHRLLVVGGQLVAAAKRVPGHVVGDGVLTIEALVEKVNEDPRRGVGHEKVLTRLEFDHQAERLLEKMNYSRDTVPAKGEIVYLRATANLSTGGTAIDVTDVIHPDNREMAERAIMAIGLDVGGVDFLTTDITESYRDTGGAICEINAAPGFRMHVAPSEGTSRDVAKPVIDLLFPAGTPTRVPIAAITGTNGKTTTSRMLAHILKLSGSTVGLASTDGVYIDGQLSVSGDMTGPASARMVLCDPSVDAAVLETARGGLLRRGMGFNRSNVSACLNVTADHLGLRGIDTVEQLAEVKRIVIEVAQDVAVFNADDALCLKMADYSNAERICYITMNHAHPLVKEHIRDNGLAVVLEEGMNGHMITVYDKGQHIPLLWTHLIPATLEGRALHNVQNSMFAAAMAHSLGISLENIRHGLRTFDTTFFQAPGRLNVYNEHPFKVILDYAHNPAAVKTICQVVDRLDVNGRIILVFSAPGDRRDEDIREIAAITAGRFDHYICRRDDHARGRGHDEVPNLLRDTLLENGVQEGQVDVVVDEQEANHRGLSLARAGDLVLILGDAVARTWKQIVYFEPGSEVVDESPAKTAGVVVDLEEYGDFQLEKGAEIIRDERGVRLAKEESD